MQLLCDSCKKHDITPDCGHCSSCGVPTASMSYKICGKCAFIRQQCPLCLTSLKPVTPLIVSSAGAAA